MTNSNKKKYDISAKYKSLFYLEVKKNKYNDYFKSKYLTFSKVSRIFFNYKN